MNSPLSQDHSPLLPKRLTALDAARVPIREEVIDLGERGVDALVHHLSCSRVGPQGAPIDFEAARSVIKAIEQDIRRCSPALPTSLLAASPEVAPQIRSMFHEHPLFPTALASLQIPESQAHLISLPWWNELAACEVGFERVPQGFVATLSVRHSYETQLMRQGVERGVSSVSGMALVLSAPENDGVRRLLIGERAGHFLPGTLHVPAGAITLSTELKQGTCSLFETFLRSEVTPELGLQDQDFGRAALGYRVYDRVIEKGGVSYAFILESTLTAGDIKQRWASNLHEDKREHRRLFFVPWEREALLQFLHQHYPQSPSELSSATPPLRLLHPSALFIAAKCGINSAALERIRLGI